MLLPPPLTEIAQPEANLKVLGDLATLWEHRLQPLDKDEHKALVRMAYQAAWPPDEVVVIPAGIDTERLLQCPLRVRTINCIEQLIRVHEPTTVGQLMALDNFGLVSLLDLMCVVEAAIQCGFLEAPDDYLTGTSVSSSHPGKSVPSDSLISTAASVAMENLVVQITWDSAIPIIKRVLATVGEPHVSQSLEKHLAQLTSMLGMGNRLIEIPIAALMDTISVSEEAVAALSEFWDSLTAIEEAILEQRILAHRPLALDDLVEATGLTRERVRQTERRVERRLSRLSMIGPAVKCWMEVLSHVVRHQLMPVTSQSDLEERISATLPYHDSRSEFDSTVIDLARHLLRQELDYSCTNDICISPTARAISQDLKTHAIFLADELGLLSENDLQKCLPSEGWLQHWDVLLQQSGLYRLSNHLALRDTMKAKAKAALLAIGRSATKEEVATLGGLTPERAGMQLSLLPGVVRADKHRWGLADWVEDEYEGIPAEIIQRINEDGGSTRLNRLLEELPRLFGVSESSVRVYLSTPAFRVEHGWVSEANKLDVPLGLFEDTINGYDDNGDPYWVFEVEDRNFNGYSIRGVPGEVVAALGCEFGGKTSALVRSPATSKDISVIWRKTSLFGPEIGRVGQTLTTLDARSGDAIRLIIHCRDEVSFERHQESPRGQYNSIQQGPRAANDTKSGAIFGGVQLGAPILANLKADLSQSLHASIEMRGDG